MTLLDVLYIILSHGVAYTRLRIATSPSTSKAELDKVGPDQPVAKRCKFHRTRRETQIKFDAMMIRI